MNAQSFFNHNILNNKEKANYYIYKAFKGEFDSSIYENLQNNVFSFCLDDMMTFDRINFEKNISLSGKKKELNI